MKKTYYIASWLQGEGEGITKVVYDKQENKVYSKELVDTVKRSSYFARNKDILYCLTEMPLAIPNGGLMSSYKMSENKLELISRSKNLDSGITHLTLSYDLKHLYGSGYGTGTLTIADIDDYNKLTNERIGYKNEGSSINSKRQESSHMHFTTPTPDGGYICTCDLGTDEVLVFKVNNDNGDITKVSSLKTPLGFGPRHMIFSKDGKYAYVLCEMSYHVLIYAYEGTGNLEFIKDVDLWPELPDDKRACSAIKISQDGKYLFTGNRGEGYNSIDVFDISDPLNLIKLDSFHNTSFPRDFTLLDDGYIAICNQHGNNIQFIQFKDNKLIETGVIENIQMPVCVIEY